MDVNGKTKKKNIDHAVNESFFWTLAFDCDFMSYSQAEFCWQYCFWFMRWINCSTINPSRFGSMD